MLRGLQETRVATREESGVLGFPSRRGLTPRGSQDEALARYGVSREVPCSALKGETVPDSLPAPPKSPPTHRRQPTRPRSPWGSLGKNTGVGCHFLLQCVKVKSEREVTQSYPTLCDNTP